MGRLFKDSNTGEGARIGGGDYRHRGVRLEK